MGRLLRWWSWLVFSAACAPAIPQGAPLSPPAAKPVERVVFCATTVSEGDALRCLWEVTPEQQRRRASTTRLLLFGDRLLRSDTVSGSGAPHELSALYEYQAGHIAEYTLENRNGVRKGRNVISADGRRVRWLDEQDRPRAQGLSAVSGLTRQVDPRGRVLAHAFVDAEGNPVTLDGVYETRWAQNASGAIVERSFFGKRGEPVADDHGAHRVVYVRDAHGELRERRYFDAQGRPALSAGVHRVRYELDAFGNEAKEAYFDAQDHAVEDEEWGAAALRYERDDRGNEVSLTLLDAQGRPKRGKGGWVSRRQRLNEQDLVMETRYVDASGAPVTDGRSGAASVRRDRNERGNVVAELLFDVQGAPTLGARGYHRVTTEYDLRDNPTRDEYTDVVGMPVLSALGYAARRVYYDGDRVTREEYLDLAGKLMNGKEGNAGYVVDYTGAVPRKRFFFASGTTVGQSCAGTASTALQSEISERAGTLRACYERLLRFGSTAEGKVMAELSIDRGGQVLVAKLVQDQLEDESLSRCVLERMSEPYQSRPESGDCVTVRVPVTFRQQRE